MDTEPRREAATTDCGPSANGGPDPHHGDWWRRDPAATGIAVEPVSVPLEELLPANDSPRLGGESCDHARALAESDAAVPPILVDRSTSRVIDGMHRLHAAILRGAREIPVVYFDGSEEDAFVVAVRANTTHGLPLARADRKAAARRIVRTHPDWSDRAIADVTGLAAKSIAEIRRATDNLPQLDTRRGKDGRARPIDSQAARQRVIDMLLKHPDASLRQIARITGVSPTTVRNVRQRMHSDGSAGTAPTAPAPDRARADMSTERRTVNRYLQASDPVTILRTLRADPSLRYSESGRALIRFFDQQLSALTECRKSVEAAPVHCRYALVQFAHAVARRWAVLAEELKKHTDIES